MLETLRASFWMFSLVRAPIPARLPLPDSPYIERVWRARSDGGGPFVSVAAGHLELVVTRLADIAMVTVPKRPTTQWLRRGSAAQAGRPARGRCSRAAAVHRRVRAGNGTRTTWAG